MFLVYFLSWFSIVVSFTGSHWYYYHLWNSQRHPRILPWGPPMAVTRLKPKGFGIVCISLGFFVWKRFNKTKAPVLLHVGFWMFARSKEYWKSHLQPVYIIFHMNHMRYRGWLLHSAYHAGAWFSKQIRKNVEGQNPQRNPSKKTSLVWSPFSLGLKRVGVSFVHASRLSSVHAQTAVFCTRVPCDVLERNKIFKKWAWPRFWKDLS